MARTQQQSPAALQVSRQLSAATASASNDNGLHPDLLNDNDPKVTQEHIRQLIPLPTKSARIRQLAAWNFPTAAIARLLDIRYQHVRNVLTRPLSDDQTDQAD